MANIHSTITYNANLSPAQAQIKALTGQIAGLTAAFNSLDKAAVNAQKSLASGFGANIGQIGGFTAKTIQAHDAVTNFGKQLAANRLTMREYFREAFAGYTKQNSMLKQLAAQQVRYQQSVAVPMGNGQTMMLTPTTLAAAGNSAAMAAAKFSIFNKLIDAGATSMLNWGKNTQWAGRQLMVGFTVPLAMFTAVASKQFRDLDKELTRFQKVYGQDLGGSISESTARMREEVKQLAYDISRTYGIAAKDTAALAADIAATGAEGDKLISGVQQTTRLAVLGEVDRQEAMKATLALQSAFKMSNSELAESINFLNAVENQTSATLEDLATAIPKVGPVIRSLGGDVKDLSVLLVAMREGGIPAAEAANALKSGLASLINPTKQASEVAKQFGVDLVGIVEANRGQLMPTIYAMQDALSGLDSFSRSKIIEQIFGKYQFARITALFDNIGKMGSQTQSVLELAGKSSAELAKIANAEIRTLTESTAVKFQRTLEELKNAIMPIGQTLTETLIPIFEFIGKGVKAFSTFFQSLPEPVKNFAKYGTAIAALAGPVIMLVGLFGNLIANGIKFGLMMTRLGARIAGIKVEPFELLNAEVMAAKLGIEGLTASFIDQETAMKRLVGVMSQYQVALRELSINNPDLFISGALPARGRSVPIKRQSGSSSPERVPGGYGGGDRIPALLEPGEMVVRKEAASQYAPIILAMNRGNIQKLSGGTQEGGKGKKIETPEGTIYFRAQEKGKSGAYQWSYKRPENLGTLPETGLARMHLASTGGDVKNLVLRIQGQAVQYLGWLDTLFTIGDQVQNQFENIAQGSEENAVRVQNAVRTTLQNNGANQEQIDRIMTNLISGVVQHEQDLVAYKNAIEGLSTEQMYAEAAAAEQRIAEQQGRTELSAAQREKLLKFRTKSLTQIDLLQEKLSLDQNLLVGANPSQIRAAIQTNAATLAKITAIQGTQEYQNATTADQLETKRLLESSKTKIINATRNLLIQLQQVSAESGAELASVFSTLLQEMPNDIRTALLREIQAQSPSIKATNIGEEGGQAIGAGVISGLRNGLNSAIQGKKIIAGPVGGGGIESISNAQKIAQAEQSILKFTEKQLPFTARRVRAEVEIAATVEKIAAIKANESLSSQERLRQLLAENERLSVLQRELEDAKRIELETQKLIDEQKQRIANADAAQARAEEEEARKAQIRASGSSSIGPDITELNTQTGPSKSINNAKDIAKERIGMRGQNLMNVAFVGSMVVSSLATMGAASEDVASKLGMLSMALMALPMLNMIPGKGIATNFLGLGSLGAKVTAAGAARQTAAAAAAPAFGTRWVQGAAGGLVPAGTKAGSGLLMAGRALSFLGGPVGIGVGLAVTAAITGFMMYKKAADEARERAIAAFNDPTKSAEYFGETLLNVSNIIEQNRLSNISEDLQGVDQALRDVVKQDYGPLIEQIKYLSAGAGAQALSTAYSNMIISGMSAENAKATIEAIATEAGMRGGEAFNEALSQGFLKNQTIQQATKNIVEQFAPSTTKYGNTETTLLETLQNELASLEQKRLDLIKSRPVVPGGRSVVTLPLGFDGSATQQELDDIARSIDAVRDRIEDLLTVNPEMVSKLMNSLTLAYTQDPTAAIDGLKEFVETLNSIDERDRLAAMSKMVEFLQTGYAEEWKSFGPTIDTHNEQLLATQMLIEGISLQHAINDANEFDTALASAAVSAKLLADQTERAANALQSQLQEKIVSDLEGKRQQLQTEIKDEQDAATKIIKSYNKRKREYEKNFNDEQEIRQDSIDSMQDEMDTRREIFDEEMDQLDKKTNAIEKSSDAYIKSLEKNSKADSFYAQQRKTSLSALEKLASGDVFGFLQEREQMSSDAQQYSYDQMISSIQEKRDLELDAIDEVRQSKQDEQKEYENMMNDRIKSTEDLMQTEQEAYDDKMRFFDREIKKAERVRDKRVEAKQDEVDTINQMIDTANSSILDLQKNFSEEYELLDPYKIQLNNLKVLKTQEIYYRGGVPLSIAALQAGIPATDIPDFIQQNRKEFAFYVENGGRGGQGRTVIPTGGDTYKFSTDQLPDTADLSQQVKDMTVTGNIIVNGDIIGGSGGATGTPTFTGGTEPANPKAGDTWFNTDTNETKTYNGIQWQANGGYITPFKDGGGGRVSGPGGPKSDVIPALLSNGEYVIQASSVKKYGKETMDAINNGKYANGGIVGYRDGTNNPTWYSADRAEQNATGTRGIPRLTKTGGGDFKPGIDYPSFNAPSFKEEVSGLWNSLRTGIATVADSFAAPFKNPLGIRTSLDQTTALGRFIGGETYTQNDPLTRSLLAMSIVPVGRGSRLPQKPGLFTGDQAWLNDFFPSGGSSFEGSNLPRTESLQLVEDLRSALADPTKRDQYLNAIFHIPLGGRNGISPGGFVKGLDQTTRYIKQPRSGLSEPAYSEVLTSKLYQALGFNVPNMDVLRLGAKRREHREPIPARYRHDPFVEDNNYFNPNSIVSASEMLSPLKSGKKKPGSRETRLILAREQGFGTAMDQWMNLTDMHSGNYYWSNNKPYRIDFGGNVFHNSEGEPYLSNPLENASEMPTDLSWVNSLAPSEVSAQWQILSQQVKNRGGVGKLLNIITSDMAKTSGLQLGNKDYVQSVLEERLLQGLQQTGQFANGGIVGFRDGTNNPTYYPTADRAERYIENYNRNLSSGVTADRAERSIENYNRNLSMGISADRAERSIENYNRNQSMGISADRAERSIETLIASQTYSGGTPTSLLGYSFAGDQSMFIPSTLTIPFNGQQHITYGGGNYFWDGQKYIKLSDVTTGAAANGFYLMYQGIKQSIDEKGFMGTLGMMAEAIKEDPASLLPFVGSSKIDTSTSEGKDLYAASLLLDTLAVIPGMTGVGAVVKAGASLGKLSKIAARATMSGARKTINTSANIALRGLAESMIGLDNAAGGLGRSIDPSAITTGARGISRPSVVATDLKITETFNKIKLAAESARQQRSMSKNPRPVSPETIGRSVSEHMRQKDWEDYLDWSTYNGLSWEDVAKSLDPNYPGMQRSAGLDNLQNFYEYRRELVRTSLENDPEVRSLLEASKTEGIQFQNKFNDYYRARYNESFPFDLSGEKGYLAAFEITPEQRGRLAVVLSEILGEDTSKFTELLSKASSREAPWPPSRVWESRSKKISMLDAPALFEYLIGADPLSLLNEIINRKSLNIMEPGKQGFSATAEALSSQFIASKYLPGYRNLSEKISLVSAKTLYPEISWTPDTPIQVSKVWAGAMPVDSGNFSGIAGLSRSDRILLNEGAHPDARLVGGKGSVSPEGVKQFDPAGGLFSHDIDWMTGEPLHYQGGAGHTYSTLNPNLPGWWTTNPEGSSMAMFADPIFGMGGASQAARGLDDAALNSALGTVSLRNTMGMLGVGGEQQLVLPPSVIENLSMTKGMSKGLDTGRVMGQRPTTRSQGIHTISDSNSGVRTARYFSTPVRMTTSEYNKFIARLKEYAQYGGRYVGGGSESPRYTLDQLMEALSIEEKGGIYTISANSDYLNYIGKNKYDRITAISEAATKQDYIPGEGLDEMVRTGPDWTETIGKQDILLQRIQEGMAAPDKSLSGNIPLNLVSKQDKIIYDKALADPLSLGNQTSGGILDAIGTVEQLLGKQLYIDRHFTSKFNLWKAGMYTPSSKEELSLLEEMSKTSVSSDSPGTLKLIGDNLRKKVKSVAAAGAVASAPLLGGWSGPMDWKQLAAILGIAGAFAIPQTRRILTQPLTAYRTWRRIRKGRHMTGDQAWFPPNPKDVVSTHGAFHSVGVNMSMVGNTGESFRFIKNINGIQYTKTPEHRGGNLANAALNSAVDWLVQKDGLDPVTARELAIVGLQRSGRNPKTMGLVEANWYRPYLSLGDWVKALLGRGFKEEPLFGSLNLKNKGMDNPAVQKLLKKGYLGVAAHGNRGPINVAWRPGVPGSGWGMVKTKSPKKKTSLPYYLGGSKLAKLSLAMTKGSYMGGIGYGLYHLLNQLGLFADGGLVEKFADGGIVRKFADGGDPSSEEGPPPSQPSRGLIGILSYARKMAAKPKTPVITPGGSPETTSDTTTQDPTETWTVSSNIGQTAANYAISQIGDQYLPDGAAQPPETWDCTKLTAWAWAVATGADPSLGYNDPKAKVRLTPYSYTQVNEVGRIGNSLDPKSWTTGGQPGDLLFFFKNGAHHASMYIGRNQVVEASSPEIDLRIEDVFSSWNQEHFSSAGRPKGFANGGLVQKFADGGIVKQVRWAQKNLIGTPYGLGHIYYDGVLPAKAYKDNYRPESIGCSPFTHLIYARGGRGYIHPYMSAIQEQNGGRGLSPNEYEPGDAIFFKGSDGEPTSHVGLLTRQTGINSWNLIHSSASKGKVVEEGVQSLVSRISKKEPGFMVSSVKRLQNGGFISGPGGPRSDVIPAMLSNGEYVVKASSVNKYGKGFMDSLNSGQLDMIPQYANGGMIGSGASMPAFNMPQLGNTSLGVTNNSYGGDTSSNSSNTSVNITINGASGKNANAIANKVISMINNANNRREHSRSI